VGDLRDRRIEGNVDERADALQRRFLKPDGFALER
jgi:hypothetical protein